MFNRRLLILGATTLVASPALADPPVWVFDSIAIGGADPVWYFTNAALKRGSADYTFVWRKETWRFVSEEDRSKFAASPEAFAPQYGGFCCMAMVDGKKSNGDARAWAIHKGKLYFAGSAAVMANWKLDSDKYISKADYWWKRSFASL